MSCVGGKLGGGDEFSSGELVGGALATGASATAGGGGILGACTGGKFEPSKGGGSTNGTLGVVGSTDESETWVVGEFGGGIAGIDVGSGA